MQERMPVSGLLPSEALLKAASWWDRIGRQRIGDLFTLEMSDNPNDETYHQSGILKKLPWRRLDMRERFAVMKAWHHENYVQPYLETMELPKKTKIAEAVNAVSH